MSELFRNTLSPAQWALLAAVPPAIFALYFLKLKRTPVEVPSTYLWKKSIEDLRVNSLWQRLRQSLLLFLQLLLVALAILALLRPGWQGTDLTGSRLIFLVDNSASMSTTDADADPYKTDGDRPRLDVAKEKVAGLIDQMERGMTAMIISYAGQPRVVQQFTDNTRLLRERLSTIEPTIGPTDLGGALELAEGLANPARVSVAEGAPDVEVVPPEPATVFILSDGRFSDVEDFALGNLEPVYVPLGSPSTANLAITALETRRSESVAGRLQAFVQAANYGAEPIDAVVELRRAGAVVDAQRLTLPAGEAAGVTLPVGDAAAAPGEGVLEARLTADTLSAAGDRLAVDNVGWAAINDPSDSRVLLVTAGNPAIEQALATSRIERLGAVETEPPGFLDSDEYRAAAAAAVYDLVIYDRCAPESSPRSHAVYVGQLPPGDAWRGGPDAEADASDASDTINVPIVIDWNRSHPLLANIELGNFDIVQSLRLDPPQNAATLIDAAEGPIAAVAARDGYEDTVLGFPILVEVGGALQRNTDWINRHSFPTFWLNVLEYCVARQSVGSRSLRPGEAVELRPASPATEEIVVVSPSGREERLRRRGERPFVYQGAGEAGVYRVIEQGREVRRFAVNLFDPAESDVRLRTEEDPEDAQRARVADIQIGNIRVASSAGAAPAREELWRWLLLAALGVLVLEWWVYHRRVYV
ncbi:BatA and WFA domain-containing protein [Botrimarina sp.]|uniref:BatA and WFA domain-containing protein n=1 Tax=Botrimarina sp. TaxID=2795802 RepID=UPI0032EF8CFF